MVPDQAGYFYHVRGELFEELNKFSGQRLDVIVQSLGIDTFKLDLPDKRCGLLNHVKIRIKLPGNPFNGP